MDSPEVVFNYFPQLSDTQRNQFARLGDLYGYWNAQINVISRKDIDNLYLHHVLHSLAIALFHPFADGSCILDIGTGGGFPGIPLAILFPKCRFVLIDSIGKKITVCQTVAKAIGLKNVKCDHQNVVENKEHYDFIVSRAVMKAPDLFRMVRKNISLAINDPSLLNGLICLKGGNVDEELEEEPALLASAKTKDINEWFKEEYFQDKKVLYLPVSAFDSKL